MLHESNPHTSLLKGGWILGPDRQYYKSDSSRPCPQLQERQALGKEGVHLHGSKGKSPNAENDKKFLGAVVHATFYISDKRTRDLSGMMETVMDCLVDAQVLPDDNWKDAIEQHSKGVECTIGEERVVVNIYIPNNQPHKTRKLIE